MPQPKKLIEVAMPIKEISAESVRDKSIRHGHISTLHLWWARRPLPVCRAVVFASLVPDPLDENCPQAFKDAIRILLGKENNPGDPYATYADIPWTAVFDPMEDNLRNRLQMFMGKFSDEMQKHLLHHKPKPGAKDQLNDFSLIKWDNKNDENIINKARKLIWVAHNSKEQNQSAKDLLADFDKHYKAIRDAEQELYSLQDRHIETKKSLLLTNNLHGAIETFLDKMPKVFDPFAGGGAIPLEAARLGCRSFGNDINPVAHIIQKGSLEFPQKYGKPITYSKAEFIKLYGKEELIKWCNENGKHIDTDGLKIEIKNRLSFDVEFYAKKLLAETEKEIGYLYPADEKGNKPIAYYWARVGTCSNPSCKAEVPLLKGFYLANTDTKKIYLKPIIKCKIIDFEIRKGICEEPGWMSRGNMQCPVCGNTTDVKTLKQQFTAGKTTERLLTIIYGSENGKIYKLPTQIDLDAGSADIIIKDIPNEPMPVDYTQAMPCCTWGLKSWSDMFNKRQLTSLLTQTQKLKELELNFSNESYTRAVRTYLGMVISKYADYNNSFTVWTPNAEQLSHSFSKQALPMVFDYPESNPFKESGGSPFNMAGWIIRFINSESNNSFSTTLKNASSR